MSDRGRLTFAAAWRGVVIVGVPTVFALALRQWPPTVFKVAGVAVVLVSGGLASYTWWWLGESPKAVSRRAKADAKKAARVGR
ncbi:hypothetical protein ABH932_000310 [Streptacidiphilus sp. MAP5-52]